MEQVSYWKTSPANSITEIASLIRANITSKQEFFGVGMREITNGIGITFFGKEDKVEKDLIIRWEGNLISYDMHVLEKKVENINGVATGIAIERNLSDINETIQFASKLKICPGHLTKGILIIVYIFLMCLPNTDFILDFELVVKLRGARLVNNQKNSNNIHEPFAILENQGQSNEAYRRVDCDLLINELKIYYAYNS